MPALGVAAVGVVGRGAVGGVAELRWARQFCHVQSYDCRVCQVHCVMMPGPAVVAVGVVGTGSAAAVYGVRSSLPVRVQAL